MARPRGQQRAACARAAQGQAGRELGAGMVGERLRRAGRREEGSLREAGGHACDPEADNACRLWPSSWLDQVSGDRRESRDAPRWHPLDQVHGARQGLIRLTLECTAWTTGGCRHQSLRWVKVGCPRVKVPLCIYSVRGPVR